MRFVLALLLAPAAPVLPVASPAMAQAAPAAALLQVLDRAFDAGRWHAKKEIREVLGVKG